MKLAMLTLSAALFSAAALTTKYTTERELRVEVETEVSLETTEMSMERDGTPVDMPSMQNSTKSKRHEVHVDRVLEVKDGRPTKVARTFDEVKMEASMSMGDQSDERTLESAFDGITVELALDDKGEVSHKVTDGDEPSGDKVFEHHTLESFLDGLLPSGDVDAKATWELESKDIARALRLDVGAALYAPVRTESEEGEGGGGGRGRGMRGSRGGNDLSMLAGAEWTGKATLKDLEHDEDGVKCAQIEIEVEAEGRVDLPERAGGGRRGDMYAPAAGLENGTEYGVKLKGTLLFVRDAAHPLSLELEGPLHLETRMERSSERGTMKMYTARSGTLTHKVSVSAAASEGAKK